MIGCEKFCSMDDSMVEVLVSCEYVFNEQFSESAVTIEISTYSESVVSQNPGCGILARLKVFYILQMSSRKQVPQLVAHHNESDPDRRDAEHSKPSPSHGVARCSHLVSSRFGEQF